MKKYLVIIMTLWMSVTQAANEQVPINRTITLIRGYSNVIIIRFSPAYANNIGCTGSGEETYVALNFNSVINPEYMHAEVLAALMAGKKVGFGLKSGTCYSYSGGTGIPEIYRVDVLP
jgi:hypothetical protein